MKTILATLVVFAFAFLGASTASALSPGYYEVIVRRLSKDIYKDSRSGAIIETRFCYIYASSPTDGLLHWESDYGYVKGTLIVGNESCEVKGIH